MQWLLGILYLIATPVWAQDTRWKINRDHSELLFKVSYLQAGEVTGRFNEFEGGLTLLADGRPKSLWMTVQTVSIDTGHKVRDGHLRANDFMKAQTYPTLEFTSEKITAAQAGAMTAEGHLLIRGVRRPFTLKFELKDALKDTWGHESKLVRFKGFIKRSEFGINWNKTLEKNLLLLGDSVEFWGLLQLQPAGQATPGPKHLIPDTPAIREREKILRGESTGAVFAPSPTRGQPTVPVPPEVSAPVEFQTPTLAPTGETRGTAWWLSFIFLGLIGFLGSTAAGVTVKKALLTARPEQYQEHGKLGMLSDLVGVILLLLYSIAFWQVGWG